MKVTKEELQSRHWTWLKVFEKRLLVSLLRAQDFLTTWRASLCSTEFWNLSWLWTALLMKLCSFRIRFSIGEGPRKNLMSWVSRHVPKRYLERGFPDCFKDGILLCALTEKLANGACPRYDLLDPDQPLRNLKLALYLIKKNIKIKPVLTAGEIHQGGKSCEKKLLLLIAHMKVASEQLSLSANSVDFHEDYMSQTTFVSDKCFARGMGLLLAVRGRKACFAIILDSTDNLDMVIEIRGPRNTACNKRITSVYSLTRGDSDRIDAQIQQDILSKEIPLTYRILGRKITVSYTPLESGTHHMSIIWQGQHIMGSPYTINVDSSVDIPDIWHPPPKRGLNRLKRTDSQCYDESVEDCPASCPESAGTITRKRILRYIVKIDGNDVVIDGKEDLCNAISCITQQQSSEKEDSFDPQEEIDSNFQNSISETDNAEFVVSSEQELGENSQVTVNGTAVNTDTDPKRGDLPSLNSFGVNASECVTIKTKDTDMKETKDFELYFESDPDIIPDEISEFSESSYKEQYESQIRDITSAKDINNQRVDYQTVQKPKLKVSFLHEKVVESNSPFSPGDFSNDHFSPDNRYLIPQTDDFNFFPVHKVEYGIIQDDDVMEIPPDCIQKRRGSFTEINESNYLDEDVHETGLVEDNLNSEAEDCRRENEADYQTELSGTDIRNCLRANHSLFQCDHSLSLFTETVVETPPELATSENEERENLSFDSMINTWENEIRELKEEYGFDNVTITELDACESNSDSEYADKGPFLTTFCETEDPFSSQCTNLVKFEGDELEPNKTSSSQDTSDKRKRPSWSDRDLLPCIRESSVEGLLELENNDDDNIRNREISDTNSYFSETKIKSKPDPQYVTISSKMHQNGPELDERFDKPSACSTDKSESRIEELINTFSNKDTNAPTGSKTEVSPKNDSLENPNKRAFSSMNILSASPYKNRSQSSKHSEIKFSTGTYLEKQTSQIPTTTLSNSQSMADSFILTYATPAIVEECRNEIDESKQENTPRDYLDPSEPKSVQCLSVKKVIEIFQKEKEEPVDTWPTETEHSPYRRKKLQENIYSPKDKDSENCLLTPFVEISRSSIKDRVKLFESDERKETDVRKHGNAERRASSSISAKKDYWESIAS